MASHKKYLYDVALSFAGEDRDHVEPLVEVLKQLGVNFFYDKYEKSSLWGKDLYTDLSDIYQNQAYFCVMFLSKHYATKEWTNRERQAAQARALKEHEEYILPVRLDDTEIPGILPTVAYLKWPPETAETIATAIMEKLLIIKSEENLKANREDSKLSSQERLIKLAQLDTSILVFVAGLPASGKTTLALALGRTLRWRVVEKDLNRDVLLKYGNDLEDAGILAYDLAFATVKDLLIRQNSSVIFDSPGLHTFILDNVRSIVEDAKAHLKVILCVTDRELRNYRLRNRSDYILSIRVDPTTNDVY